MPIQHIFKSVVFFSPAIKLHSPYLTENACKFVIGFQHDMWSVYQRKYASNVRHIMSVRSNTQYRRQNVYSIETNVCW